MVTLRKELHFDIEFDNALMLKILPNKRNAPEL
jgi:hypothetical protein